VVSPQSVENSMTSGDGLLWAWWEHEIFSSKCWFKWIFRIRNW